MESGCTELDEYRPTDGSDAAGFLESTESDTGSDSGGSTLASSQASMCSTPVAGRTQRRPGSPEALPVHKLHGGVNRRNNLRKKRRRRPLRINYTAEFDCTVPGEPNHRTESKWRPTRAKLLRFVDDGFCLSKVNFENSYGFVVNGIHHSMPCSLRMFLGIWSGGQRPLA